MFQNLNDDEESSSDDGENARKVMAEVQEIYRQEREMLIQKFVLVTNAQLQKYYDFYQELAENKALIETLKKIYDLMRDH